MCGRRDKRVQNVEDRPLERQDEIEDNNNMDLKK
jgi:hypothetical protein